MSSPVTYGCLAYKGDLGKDVDIPIGDLVILNDKTSFSVKRTGWTVGMHVFICKRRALRWRIYSSLGILPWDDGALIATTTGDTFEATIKGDWTTLVPAHFVPYVDKVRAELRQIELELAP